MGCGADEGDYVAGNWTNGITLELDPLYDASEAVLAAEWEK